MKKVFFGLFLIIVICSISKDAHAYGPFIGVSVGINNVSLSKLDPLWIKGGTVNDKISSSVSKYSFIPFLYGGYSFSNKWSVVTGIGNYSAGQHYTDSLIGQRVEDVNLTIKNVYIPLMLRYTAGHGGSGFYVEAGPHTNLMQSAIMSNSSDLLGNYKTDVTSYFTKRDFGFSLGLGIHFQPSDHLGLQFGFRGIYGRQNINLLTPTTKVTTSALGLQIGAEYRF